MFRIAHQPNVLPDLNIVAQAIYADHVAAASDGSLAPFFLLVDETPVKQARMVRCKVWDPGVKGHLSQLGADLPVDDDTILSAIDDDLARSAFTRLTSEARGYVTRLGWDERSDHLGADTGDLVGPTDWCAASLVHLVSRHLGSTVAFVPLSELADAMCEPVMELALALQAVSDLDAASLYWWVCPDDGQRNALIRVDQVSARSTCTICGAEASVDLTRRSAPDSGGRLGRRVLIDGLADWLVLGAVAGTHYGSSKGHILDAAARLCGLAPGVRPVEAVWRVRPWLDTEIDHDIRRLDPGRPGSVGARLMHLHASGRLSSLSVLRSDVHSAARLSDTMADSFARRSSPAPGEAVDWVIDPGSPHRREESWHQLYAEAGAR